MTATKGSFTRSSSLLAAIICGAGLAGCAADGGFMETGSITPAAQPAVKTASIDPQCATLAQQIEQIKTEGTVGRLEKVAEGKSATAVVKRNALQQQAQLNKANAEYIAKCGVTAPRTAAVAPAVSATAQPGASGVTVVAPKAAAPATTAETAAVTTAKAATSKAATTAKQ
ncbi:MAG TPA: hypothetical protein PK970_04595 [Hyphomicrobiaceae bacterium]|nr:hypothetical protein [Hyphomicrobiaceae bacterium]